MWAVILEVSPFWTLFQVLLPSPCAEKGALCCVEPSIGGIEVGDGEAKLDLNALQRAEL